MPLRVLFDTSVLRAGFVSDAGALRRLLTAALTGRVVAIASTVLMLEYEDVLLRPETLERAGVLARDALAFLAGSGRQDVDRRPPPTCSKRRAVAGPRTWPARMPDAGACRRCVG